MNTSIAPIKKIEVRKVEVKNLPLHLDGQRSDAKRRASLFIEEINEQEVRGYVQCNGLHTRNYVDFVFSLETRKYNLTTYYHRFTIEGIDEATFEEGFETVFCPPHEAHLLAKLAGMHSNEVFYAYYSNHEVNCKKITAQKAVEGDLIALYNMRGKIDFTEKGCYVNIGNNTIRFDYKDLFAAETLLKNGHENCGGYLSDYCSVYFAIRHFCTLLSKKEYGYEMFCIDPYSTIEAIGKSQDWENMLQTTIDCLSE